MEEEKTPIENYIDRIGLNGQGRELSDREKKMFEYEERKRKEKAERKRLSRKKERLHKLPGLLWKCFQGILVVVGGIAAILEILHILNLI